MEQSAGTRDATYTPGTLLYAFNTGSSWTSFGASTQQSGLPIPLRCFNMMPTMLPIIRIYRRYDSGFQIRVDCSFE